MDSKTKVKKILKLGIPTTIENILQTTVGFIDTLMISTLGLISVTAVGISNTLFSVYLAIIIAIGVGTSSLISRALGAKNLKKAREITIQSLVSAIIVGLILGGITLIFRENLLKLVGAELDVIKSATPYLLLVGGGTIFISLITIEGSILKATGDTKTPMKVNALVNVLNVLFDIVLIFGLGPIPAMGILGTAIGTVLSRLIGAILMFVSIQKTELRVNFKEMFKKYDYKELTKLSIPAALERLVMRLGQVLYSGLIMTIGAITYAAHTIAGTIESFTYMPGYGLAAASSVLVGQSIGEGNKKDAYEYGVLSAKLGALIMGVLGIVLFFTGGPIATLFTDDVLALEKITKALKIISFAQIPLAISLILTGALQGMGDTKSPLYSTAFGIWCLRVLGIYVLGYLLKLDIVGIWLSILIDLTFRAIFLIYKYRKNFKHLDLRLENDN